MGPLRAGRREEGLPGDFGFTAAEESPDDGRDVCAPTREGAEDFVAMPAFAPGADGPPTPGLGGKPVCWVSTRPWVTGEVFTPVGVLFLRRALW